MAKKKYVVKPGDNLLKLAEKYGVSIQELQQENGINSLTPGQTIRVPVQKTKGRAWVTGEDERKTTTVNGQQIRLGPNSYVAPQTDGGFLDQLNNFLFPQQNPSQINGTRGNVTPGKGINGLASPTAYDGNGIGAAGGAGAVSYQTGEGEYRTVNYNGQDVRMGPNSTFTPRNKPTGFLDQLNSFLFPEQQPSQINGTRGALPPGSGKAMFRPAAGAFGGVGGVESNIGSNGTRNIYGEFSVPPPITTGGGLSPDKQGVLPGRFSYAPQGQPSSYQPYNNQFPNLQLAMRPNTGNVFTNQYTGPVNPVAAPVAPQTGNYGNYAPGNKLYSGQAKTAQEAFQQGKLKVGKRWWIGRGKTHGENKPVVAQPIIQGNDIQQGTWRV